MTDETLPANDEQRNPIVRVENGEVLADSRDVAAYFDKNHFDVLKAIRNIHCSPEFGERNFASFRINDLTGESTSHVMMTKDGFAFLAMGFTGEKAGAFKEAYIQRFNAIEAELRARLAFDPEKALNDPAWLRPALLAYTEKVIALEGQVADMEPKVQALERIAESDGDFCVTDAAKTLQVRPKDLFAFLRSHGWIYSRPGGSEVAYQSKLSAGLLVHKTTTVHRSDGTEKTVTQVRVTPKGLTRLAQEFPSVFRAA